MVSPRTSDAPRRRLLREGAPVHAPAADVVRVAEVAEEGEGGGGGRADADAAVLVLLGQELLVQHRPQVARAAAAAAEVDPQEARRRGSWNGLIHVWMLLVRRREGHLWRRQNVLRARQQLGKRTEKGSFCLVPPLITCCPIIGTNAGN